MGSSKVAVLARRSAKCGQEKGCCPRNGGYVQIFASVSVLPLASVFVRLVLINIGTT